MVAHSSVLSNDFFLFRFSGNGPESEDEEDQDPDFEEAVNELVPVLATEDDESYLNMSLEEETSIIVEYRTMILSSGYNANSASFKS